MSSAKFTDTVIDSDDLQKSARSKDLRMDQGLRLIANPESRGASPGFETADLDEALSELEKGGGVVILMDATPDERGERARSRGSRDRRLAERFRERSVSGVWRRTPAPTGAGGKRKTQRTGGIGSRRPASEIVPKSQVGLPRPMRLRFDAERVSLTNRPPVPVDSSVSEYDEKLAPSTV